MLTLNTYSIMKYNEFFKHNFSFQEKIASHYRQEVYQFQNKHNSSAGSDRIWRHQLYPRTFYFFRNGIAFSVRIYLVRFIYAGTSRTFTFYGTLFCAFSRYSKEFISSVLSEGGNKYGDASCLVSVETASRWVSGHLPAMSPQTSPGYTRA